MTEATPDVGTSELSNLMATIKSQLQMMRQELEDLQQEVRAGKFENLKTSIRTNSDIRNWLKSAIDTEFALNEHSRTIGHIGGGAEIDFDQARSEIGCRLARLRAARCPGRIPE